MKTHSQLIREGLAHSVAMGRRVGRPVRVTDEQITAVLAMGTAEAAETVGMSVSQFILRRKRIEKALAPKAKRRT